MEKDEIFMGKAIELSALAVEHGNEPFGAVLVRDGEIVYTNETKSTLLLIQPFMRKQGLSEGFAGKHISQT